MCLFENMKVRMYEVTLSTVLYGSETWYVPNGQIFRVLGNIPLDKDARG